MDRRSGAGFLTRLRSRRDRYALVRLSVIGIGCVAGAVAATLAQLDVPWAVGGGLAGIVAGAAIAKQFLTEVVDPARSAAAAKGEVDRRLALVLHNQAGHSPLRCADPYSIGVWRSAAADEYREAETLRPPYFTRSIDETLQTTLVAVGARGGVVVVAGHPKAGKSRTLFEALATSPATRERTLYALRTPDGTGAAATTRPFDTLLDAPLHIDGSNSVLWIDDAHEHFPYGLTRARLHEVLERYPGLIVAMTVHLSQLDPSSHRPDTGELTSVDGALLDELWELSRDHILDVTLSDGEQDGARRSYPGLLDAVEDPIDVQRLPSWFAGVDYLRRRYRAAGPEHYGGVAVARAAMHWRRAGMPAGIDDKQLRELAEIALAELDPRATFAERTYAAALAWAQGHDPASEPRWRGVALLRREPGTDPTRWHDFDAVTTWVTGGPNGDPPLSYATWNAITNHVTPATGVPVGIAAYLAGELDIAIKAHRVDADDPVAMSNLGGLLAERGEVAEAEQWYRRAAIDHDNPNAMSNLGGLLEGRGEVAEAEQWYRRAAIDHDHPMAISNLGVLLAERGEVAEAEQWWRRAAIDHENPLALFNLGFLHSERGEVAEAEQWWRRAAIAHNPVAMYNLGVLLMERGEVAEAEQWWRRAAIDHDSPDAMYNLGVLLMGRGEVAEAERWWRRASVDHDRPDAMSNLGAVLAERGEVAEAEQWWRRAATDHDNPLAMSNLGALFEERGEGSEAEQWFERARQHGFDGSL